MLNLEDNLSIGSTLRNLRYSYENEMEIICIKDNQADKN